MQFAVFHLRSRSLLRGTLLVLVSLLAAFLLSDFPHNRATLLLLLPALIALYGTWDTTRCLRHRWSLYHGAVLLLLYADMMALAMILFFLFYPYAGWLL
ncbi:MAG TPA: hypothetical protein VM554_15780 [Acidisarcina sp.]|nr:hypothetical protein [Acidisarcina sp.]